LWLFDRLSCWLWSGILRRRVLFLDLVNCGWSRLGLGLLWRFLDSPILWRCIDGSISSGGLFNWSDFCFLGSFSWHLLRFCGWWHFFGFPGGVTLGGFCCFSGLCLCLCFSIFIALWCRCLFCRWFNRVRDRLWCRLRYRFR
jgi:hypothetical protein